MVRALRKKPTLKGGKGGDRVPEVEKPSCMKHGLSMVYVSEELIWRCTVDGCRVVSRVKMLSEARPTILRGPVRFFLYEDTPFILFVDSSILVPVDSLDSALINEGDDEVTVSIPMKIQRVTEQ